MKKKCEKALRHARQKGFDQGFNMAKAVFSEVAAAMIADLIEKHQREIEALNSELILGQDEEGEEDEDEQRLDT